MYSFNTLTGFGDVKEDIITLESTSILFAGLNFNSNESSSSIKGSILPKILKGPSISFLLYMLVEELRGSKSFKGSVIGFEILMLLFWCSLFDDDVDVFDGEVDGCD